LILDLLGTIDEAPAMKFARYAKPFNLRKLCSAASASLNTNASIVARVTQPLRDPSVDESSRTPTRSDLSYIGTVACLEPFHGDSYYHRTHLGTLNTLRIGRFDVEHVAPAVDWSGLQAQATMRGLFP